jgi:glyoxylase-like metal-dependent hydrolase (beta-lactamase superfamily II)
MGVARADLRLVAIEAPAEGQLLEVARGVYWARFALPFRLNHINVWLIQNRDGLIVVDSGISDERTKALWGVIAKRLDSLGRVQKVICTHHHPDHCGLIGWVAQQFDAPIAMSRTEWSLGQYYLHEDDPAVRETTDRFYLRAGYPLGFFNGQNVPFKSLTSDYPAQYQRLVGGKTTISDGDWTVMTFGGHAPEHVCLYNAAEKILIAGDQVLPTISPIVGVAPHEPEENPLEDYLQSLKQLRQLPAETLVLPSHGHPFLALHKRIEALIAHHERRLLELRNALSIPTDAATLTTKLFPDVGPGFDLIFALTETIAHVRYLQARGQIRSGLDQKGIEMFELM